MGEKNTGIGRYQIHCEVGRGGMGTVFKARDPVLERDVAVKVIRADLLDPDMVERFKRETRLAARMDHPAIVPVHDVGEQDGALYFVMPFVTGQNLRNLITERSLRLDDVLEIGIQMAEALEYSHGLGVIHRDIKPENILVCQLEAEGLRLRVTDFGLATATSERRITTIGWPMGTPAYMSPEQLSAGQVDHRSDLYSLGAVLYECLCGESPFSGEIQVVFYRILHEPAPPLTSRGAKVDDELQAIITRCLEKDPLKRPQSARELREALVQYRARLRLEARSLITASSIQPERIPRPVSFRFVSREKELAELSQRLAAAAEGECQFVAVAGEAGVGKSRLLEELESLARIRNITTLHGRFLEQNRVFPYQGYCEVIQEYFRISAGKGSATPVDFSDLASDLLALFPVLTEIENVRALLRPSGPLPPPGDTTRFEDRTRIFELLARTFARMGAGKPMLVLLEDLHGADASVDALEYIVRRLGPTPTLFVVTYRKEEVGKAHPLMRLLDSFQGDRRFGWINLESFSLAEHRVFVESLLTGSTCAERLLENLYAATEGNPFFTRELVRSLIDSGGMVQSASGFWRMAGELDIPSDLLPDTVQQTVEKRIERLSQPARDLLALAAVLGRRFDLKDLFFLAGKSDEAETIVEQLIQDGFLEEERASRGDHLAFSSGVLREVIYTSLPRRRRRHLHRLFTEELEHRNTGRLDRVLPQLLYHSTHGDIPEKVVDYGLKLARKSLETFSPEEAEHAARAVLDFLEEGAAGGEITEGETRLLLASACRMAGKREAALQEFEAAILCYQRDLASPRLLEALVTAAHAAWEERKIDQARRWVEQGLELARAASHTECLLRLLSLGATLANLRGEHERAKAYLEEADPLRKTQEDTTEALPEGGTLVVGFTVPVQATHPAEIRLDEEAEILSNVFETMIRPDDQGNLLPHLVTSWEPREGGRSFLLRLRRGVRFHDGTELTATDVKRSFETGVRRAAHHLPPAFSAIAEVEAFLSGTNTQLMSVKVQDVDAVEFQLAEPLPIFPALLTDSRTAICRVVQLGGGEEKLFGTGPFQLDHREGGNIRLRRNPAYWKLSPPIIEAVEFRTGISSAEIAAGVRTGELDLVRDLLPADLDEILRDRRLRAGLVETPKKSTYFVIFSTFTPAIALPEIRRALRGVIRSRDLVRRTLGRFAEPAEGLLPRGIQSHDPNRRRRYLTSEEANGLMGNTPRPLKLYAAVHPIFQDRFASLATELFRVWAELGVEVENVTPDMKSFLATEKVRGTIDLIVGRYIADYDDPDDFCYQLFHSKRGVYRNYCASNEMDQLIEAARMETSQPERMRLYHKIENSLLDQEVILPLFHDIDCRVTNPKVRHLALSSTPPYVNYTQVAKMKSIPVDSVRRKAGGNIHVPVPINIRSIDPALIIWVQEAEVCQAIFETLTREGEGSRIVPGLATEFQAEQGGRRFRFRLRDGVCFHDGRPLRAADVRFSFERLLLCKESDIRWLLSPIRGAKAMLEGNRGSLDGFNVISPREFTIDLEEPVGFFPTLLSYHATAILPEGTERLDGTWRDGFVGTGPFRVARYEPGQRVELEANPYYWSPGLPRCDSVTFTFGVPPGEIVEGFRSGRFTMVWDLDPAEMDKLRRDTRLAPICRELPSLSTYSLIFDINHGPCARKDVRQRIVGAVDVEGLTERTIGRLAVPAKGFIPPSLLGYEPAKRAVPLVSKSKTDSAGTTLTGLIHRIYDGPCAKLATELFEIIHRLGYEVKIVPERVGSVEAQSAKVNFVLTRWIADYPDADAFTSGVIHSKKGYEGRHCGTSELDRLIERGRAETDPDIRHEIYHQIEDYIAREAIILPLFHEQACRLARPEVEDFEITFSGPHVLYEKLWIKK